MDCNRQVEIFLMTAIGWCELTYVFVQPGSAVNTAFERAGIRKTTQRSADTVLIIKYVSTEHNLYNNVFTYKKHDDIMFFKKPEMLKNKHFRLFLFLVCF